MSIKRDLIRIGVALALLAVVGFVYAAPVNESTAKKIASRFVTSFSSLRSAPVLSLVYTGEANEGLRSGQTPLYYVYNIDANGGFVIVSGDDVTHPIFGYATSGRFKTEDMPANLAYWLDFYKQEMLYYIEQGVTPSPEIKDEWQSLSYDTKATTIEAGLELSTAKWNQSTPFNNLCPLDDKEKVSVTGCVATAMAIVMHYHRWPEKGTGSIRYYTRTTNRLASANYGAKYNWDNMLPEYVLQENVPTWTDQQATAVATLMFHCGTSVEMDYKSTASGAYAHDIVPAMNKYFDYDNGSVLRCRDLYTLEEWEEMIKKEIDEERPVLYGGITSSDEGHQFVVDGYAKTDHYYHLNWGWGGYCDGYYRLSSLNPAAGGIGGAISGKGYDYDQNAIIGLQKAQAGSQINNELYYLDYEPKEIDKPKGVFGLYTDVDHVVQNEPFTLYFSCIYDYGRRDFTGEVALFLENSARERKQMILGMKMEKGSPNGILEAGYMVYDDKGSEVTITEEVEEGDMLRMYYKPAGHDWLPLRGDSKATEALPIYKESPVANEAICLEETVQVFPTRVQTGLTISLPEGVVAQRVSLYDMSGRLVKQEAISQSDSSLYLSLDTQQPGIYILSVQTSRGESRHKIIKE
ncbi:thiol protease/hemagglutinin PrtT [Parabacteroides sp. OttesenSCG-928-B22]|nr:thiol protease/hemagglutinin PrtT [Parabacteroides sp. OttesenSCG-928-B22]